VKNNLPTCAFVSCFVLVSSLPALAQPRTGWSTQVDGFTVFQGQTDLDGGGEFSASRTFLRAGAIYTAETGNSAGVSASFGFFDYDFDKTGRDPWGNIRDYRISAPVRFAVSETATVFLAPQARWDHEKGADVSDSFTYGVFAGVSWQLTESLTVGPAVGVYSQLEDSGADVFPALLIDWDIDERWNLTTGSGLGATGGPGLTLGYAVTDTWKISLSARSESVRFRLDDDGPAPDGIGEDKSLPVVLSLQYDPNPGMAFSAFVGAEFNGRLRLEDSSGSKISRQDYDTAPLAGIAFRVRF
jgi:hypothetical protein